MPWQQHQLCLTVPPLARNGRLSTLRCLLSTPKHMVRWSTSSVQRLWSEALQRGPKPPFGASDRFDDPCRTKGRSDDAAAPSIAVRAPYLVVPLPGVKCSSWSDLCALEAIGRFDAQFLNCFSSLRDARLGCPSRFCFKFNTHCKKQKYGRYTSEQSLWHGGGYMGACIAIL